MSQPWQALQPAREQFIESGRLEQGVRELVGLSWLRSTTAGVDPDSVTPSFDPDPEESQTHLLIGQVLARAAAQLGDEPVSIIYADQNGRVVHRFCSDPELARHLERVSLAPGFTYAEETVGTNGIGTALMTRQPTMIVGGEHFTGPLTTFACAGAPVHHPISGTLLGVLDLTCASSVSSGLLLTVARSIAERIESELLAKVSVSEMTLLRDYLAACRHATGPVLALGQEVMMMNRLTQQRLDVTDRTALVARTGDAFGADSPLTFVADLPSGTVARLDYRPTSVGQRVVGGVFRVQLQQPPSEALGAPLVSRSTAATLPGVAGASPEFSRAVHQLRDARRRNASVVFEGESGVGKFALLRAVHTADTPERHFRVLDAAAASLAADQWLEHLEEEVSTEEGILVLRHVDHLPHSLVDPVAGVLEEHANAGSARGLWVVATRCTGSEDHPLEAKILPLFERTVVLEPLRHRPDDIRLVAPQVLRGLSPKRELSLSREALNQLTRHPWPGNVSQLRDVLRKVVATKRSGSIESRDLPPECMAVGRRNLTPLEALERDAITRALHDHGGNKELAAQHLGMSRATIYRKIKAYTIDIRASVPTRPVDASGAAGTGRARPAV